MNDKSITLSKNDLIDLLQKAFNAGWGGYKDLGEDIACQLAEDYIATFKKTEKDKEKKQSKEAEHLRSMSEKLSKLVHDSSAKMEIGNEYTYTNSYGTPYGVVVPNSYASNGLRINSPESMYTLSPNSSGNITIRQ